MIATVTNKYTLKQINDIAFQGFEFIIPEETANIINNLSQQVGNGCMMNPNVFYKKELSNVGNGKEAQNLFASSIKTNKKRRGNRSMEIDDNEWDNLRSFQTTKIVQKTGIHSYIDQIRLYLNKLTDKTFLDMREKIIDLINKIMLEDFTEEDAIILSNSIYNISSANKFYSKIFADLYAELLVTYDWLRPVFDNHLNEIMLQFENIEYYDPNVNYDRFCEMNKKNEARKSNTLFMVNLAKNGCIPKITIVKILKQLIDIVLSMLNKEDKKNEVDEITENVAILFSKELIETVENENEYETMCMIGSDSIVETVTMLAKYKAKDYPSLSNKTIFKYMDLIEM